MKEPYFRTIFGTYLKLSDVEDPDELVEPSEYYTIVSNLENNTRDWEDEENEFKPLDPHNDHLNSDDNDDYDIDSLIFE